jgi:hypothetical protein
MNNTRGSTPPNPNFDLPNRSTDFNKTLGIIGIAHEESIATILSTKTCQIKTNRRNPAKNSSIPRALKTPNQAPKDSHKFPPSNPKGKVPKTPQGNHQERDPKVTTKNNREQHNKALRNHAESSIHAKEVHTRSSLPPDHPTLS